MTPPEPGECPGGLETIGEREVLMPGFSWPPQSLLHEVWRNVLEALGCGEHMLTMDYDALKLATVVKHWPSSDASGPTEAVLTIPDEVTDEDGSDTLIRWLGQVHEYERRSHA